MAVCRSYYLFMEWGLPSRKAGEGLGVRWILSCSCRGARGQGSARNGPEWPGNRNRRAPRVAEGNSIRQAGGRMLINNNQSPGGGGVFMAAGQAVWGELCGRGESEWACV